MPGRRIEPGGVPLLDDVEEAGRAFREQQEHADEARRRLYETIRAAHTEGVPAAAIARAAGLSRERVRQIILAAGPTSA